MNQFLSDLKSKGFNIAEQEVLPYAIFIMEEDNTDLVALLIHGRIINLVCKDVATRFISLSSDDCYCFPQANKSSFKYIAQGTCEYLKFTVNKNLKLLRPKDKFRGETH